MSFYVKNLVKYPGQNQNNNDEWKKEKILSLTR
jgi:hypothetical protein